jgi:hypothetical protein
VNRIVFRIGPTARVILGPGDVGKTAGSTLL